MSKLRKDLSLATLASLFSFVISLGLTPIMTRCYEPSDYGVFALINNVAIFVATVLLFSLPNAIPMERKRHRRKQLLRALLSLAVLAFVLSTIGITIFLFINSMLYGVGDLQWILFLIPFLVLSIILQRIAQGLANADGAFSSMSAARFAHPVIAKPFAIIASILIVSNPIFIVLFEMLGYLFQTYLMLQGRVQELKELRSVISKRFLLRTLGIIRRYSEYSLFLNLVNLVSLGFITMQTVIISINYSVIETGLFSLAMSMASLPIQLIALATASIIYHKLISIADQTPNILFKKTVKILIGYMTLGIIPYMSIFLFGSELFGFIFGSEWIQSGQVASLLAVPLFIQFVLMPITSLFRVTKTIKLQFIVNLILIIPIILLFVFASWTMPFLETIKILAIAMTLQGLIVIGYCLYVAKQTSELALKVQKVIE